MMLSTLSICHYPVTLFSTALSRDHCHFSVLGDAQYAEHLSLPGDPFLDRHVTRLLPTPIVVLIRVEYFVTTR